MKKFIYDTAIVGAGAAGLMTAIQCRYRGLSTLLLDSREKVGAKILMSGGTRCNVTNQLVSEKDFASNEPRLVRNILRAYPSEKALQFFHSIGLKLTKENDGKYFPSTNRAKTVLDSLLCELTNSGAHLKTGFRISSAKWNSQKFELTSNKSTFYSKTLVLATGGLSYPETGSDGHGYSLAKSFGHSLIETIPALTPFLTNDKDFKNLTGVALPVSLSLQVQNKKILSFDGPLLFTHFGFSGPTALNMSRHWLRAKSSQGIIVSSNFLPNLKETTLRNSLISARTNMPKRYLKNFFTKILPNRFINFIFQRTNIQETQIVGQLSKDNMQKLLETLYRYPLPITGVYGYKKAEVTAGGINLAEINTATLESKKRPGLFFVGEILDADGRIGGFNFQWAWATGAVAAEGIRKNLNIHQSK